uniref:Fibronectin type-III domain-containing protein n=1 Tax=Lates calcarifer TaxID=8187 RepID=A0A4W6FVS3_LATCA
DEIKQVMPVRDRMYFILLILGNIATVTAVPGVHNETGLYLDCTNNLDGEMSCDFDAQNCSEYSLTLQKICSVPKECGLGRCCCSVQMTLVLGETHTATVWKRGERIQSKNISISESIKPKTPTITSVEEVNGNFQVMWETNMKSSFSSSPNANVTYHIKGDTKKVCQFIPPTSIGELKMYEISGQDLEPSTTYVVSVKSFSDWSEMFSESSNEWEFTTSVSPNAMLLAIIISLSIVAVLISGAIFGCYVKSKVSLTDTSSGSLQQSSGISIGSSCLSYANTEPADIITKVNVALCKAFPNISPISPLTTSPLTELNKDSGLFSVPFDVRADDVDSGSSGFDNKTYSILMPSCPHQLMDSSEVQSQAEMLFDSGYHPSEGGTVSCADHEAPACPLLNLPPGVSSLMPSDMSYQQCNADSGRFSDAEDSSLSSVSSGTNTLASTDPVSRVEAGCDSLDEVIGGPMMLNGKTEEVPMCDDNPCYGCVPAGSHSFPPVDDDYQAFQNLVGQPDVFFSEQKSEERVEHFDKYPADTFTVIPPETPCFINNVQGGQCLSELQRPFLSLIAADQPIPVITDSGYQSV